jgi:hypothetical protein
MAEDDSHGTTEGAHDLSDHVDDRIPVTGGNIEERISRRHVVNAPARRRRASSYDSSLSDRKRQPCHSLSPLASWDDSTFNHNRYLTPKARVDGSASIHQHGFESASRFQGFTLLKTSPLASTLALAELSARWVKLQREKQYTVDLQSEASHKPGLEADRCKTYQAQRNPTQMNQFQLGVTLRRASNINIFDDLIKLDDSGSDARLSSGQRRNASIVVLDDPKFNEPKVNDPKVNHSVGDAYLSSRPASSAVSGSGEVVVEERFLQPEKYFRDLDDLGSKIFEKSMFQFYTVSYQQ